MNFNISGNWNFLTVIFTILRSLQSVTKNITTILLNQESLTYCEWERQEMRLLSKWFKTSKKKQRWKMKSRKKSEQIFYNQKVGNINFSFWPPLVNNLVDSFKIRSFPTSNWTIMSFSYIHTTLHQSLTHQREQRWKTISGRFSYLGIPPLFFFGYCNI